jgi:transcriptional regulator with XRE-family HTH domain
VLPKKSKPGDDLYQEVGRRIRSARERSGLKLSQEKLAKKLNMSRASIVNIEAGRQHAPLHLLWLISGAIETELALLIPRREELTSKASQVSLDDATVKLIKEAVNGDPETQKAVADLASRLKSSIESIPQKKQAT